MKHKLSVLMALSCLAAVAVAAEAPAKQEEAWTKHFNKADTDKSGSLSRAELDKTGPNEFPVVKKRFDEIDRNKDGQITPDEYAEFTQKRRDAWLAKFKAADLDGSKGLSRAELDKTRPQEFGPIKKNFDAMDSNKDGQVSVEEYDNFMPKYGR